jgi:hypothetical protein
MAVLFIAYDNTGTNGADPYSSISDTGGNTWTSRQNVLNDPGAANAGVAGRIFTSLLTAQLTTGSTITVNFGAFSVPAKAWALRQVSGSVGVPTFKTAGAAGGQIPASATVPQMTTGSITNGSLLMAAWFREGNAAPSASDTDTTNGTWGSLWGTGQGSAATGIEVRAQSKPVTATATQSYDHTYAAGRDTVGGWIEIEEVVSNIVVTPTTAALVLSTFAPVLKQTVTPDVAALVLTTFAPSANVGSPPVVPGTASLVLTTFAPVLKQVVTPGAAALVLTPFAPVLKQVVTPGAAALALTPFAPVLKQVVTPTTKAVLLVTFAPTVTVSLRVVPTTASLALTAFAPVLKLQVTPATAALILTTFAPSVDVSAPNLGLEIEIDHVLLEQLLAAVALQGGVTHAAALVGDAAIAAALRGDSVTHAVTLLGDLEADLEP